MNALLTTLGSLAGTVGILICLIAGVTRLSGSYYLFGYSAQSLLMIGAVAIIVACYLKLEHLSRTSR
ncbi:hypothetical protein [Sedimenticola thiotaurini]|uniref:Uncharacterized protein n=1 Tax=Sedimenticola thiotaurini TaxID=1543721 RepID=A0A0F7JYK3_9GAMM|nr:hypothetical protein [Sedimenticola thiotaurini]AKH19728.1 hypothetical protein AAY24_04430 [Sedimenticola thiotaurini]